MNPILRLLWEPLEEMLFPNTPKLKERRRLRQIERSLKKAGVISGYELNISGKWASQVQALASLLGPFQPLFGKTLGSSDSEYRLLLARRFWEASFGEDFQTIHNNLLPASLIPRFLRANLAASEKEAVFGEAKTLIDWVRRTDPVGPSQEWNALYWFSELVLFPYESILHPWDGKGPEGKNFKRDCPAKDISSPLEDFYHILSALNPGRALEQSVVRFCSAFVQDEAKIADIFNRIKKTESFLYGPCAFDRVRDLIRVIEGNPDAQPVIGKVESHWFANFASEFERKLLEEIDKAWAEAQTTWLNAEISALFGTEAPAYSPGYGDAENLVLAKAGFQPFVYARAIAVFKSYYLRVVKPSLLPLCKRILLGAVFIDKDFSHQFTRWVYRMDDLDKAITAFEYRILDGHLDSWPTIAASIELKGASKNGARTTLMIDELNTLALDLLNEWTKDILNFLEFCVILDKDRRSAPGIHIQNWRELSLAGEDGGDILEKALSGARRFFRVMRFYLPIQSGLLAE